MTAFKRSFFFLLFAVTVLPGFMEAAQYDIKIMTPEVQAAIQGRQQRYDLLQQMKAEGLIGESNQGYVSAIGASGAAASVVAAENADRQAIYSAIVEQNALGAAGMAQVQLAFAEVQREKARSGDHIQLASGQWTQK